MNNINPQFPLISIVTPSFNQGKFLAKTIESVIGQAGDFLIDYIIVDGASSDNSVDIIRQYEEMLLHGEWPINCRGIRYRWLSEADKGQSDALGKGFRMAEGDIFAWLNSDDTYLSGALQNVADTFHSSPGIALIYGDAHYCGNAGSIIGRYRTEKFDYGKLAWFNFICQPSTFFRRDVFEAVGGLDDSLHFAMDYDLWLRIGKRFPCRYLPLFLSTYRLHESSKTVSDKTLMDNAEEGLSVAMKHFGWAPLTRVYNACHPLCRSRLPAFLARKGAAVAFAALFCSMYRSIRLNHGVNRKDIKLLTRENFRKIFKTRLEVMTGESNRDRM
jgi:glycosyltransferase involved in cell wall biosynthesis